MKKTLYRGLTCGAAIAVLQTAPVLAQSSFEGRYKIGMEAERKACINCTSSEYENEIEATLLDLIVKPKDRKDLSFGLELKFETEGDGAFWGGGRTDIVNNSGLGLWVRKDFDKRFWARAQVALETDEEFVDLGGRIGFSRDLSERTQIKGYANLDRRFPLNNQAKSANGTYLELGTELEWEMDNYGFWVELETSKWFFGPATKADEREFIVQPGLWIDLGASGHIGLAWFEIGQKKLTGAREKEESYKEIGVGAEFSLKRNSSVFVGVSYGREATTKPQETDEKASIYKLELTFEKSF